MKIEERDFDFEYIINTIEFSDPREATRLLEMVKARTEFSMSVDFDTKRIRLRLIYARPFEIK